MPMYERELSIRWQLMCEQIAQSFAMFGLLLLGGAHAYGGNGRGVLLTVITYAWAYACWRFAAAYSATGLNWTRAGTWVCTVAAIATAVWSILEYNYY